MALRWSTVSAADGYRVLRSSSASGFFVVSCTVNVLTGAATASDGVVNVWSDHHTYVPASKMSGRDNSATFEYVEVRGADARCFKVVAFNTAGDSAPSAAVCGAPSS